MAPKRLIMLTPGLDTKTGTTLTQSVIKPMNIGLTLTMRLHGRLNSPTASYHCERGLGRELGHIQERLWRQRTNRINAGGAIAGRA